MISKVPESDLFKGTVSLPSGLVMQRLTWCPPWSHTNLVGNVLREDIVVHCTADILAQRTAVRRHSERIQQKENNFLNERFRIVLTNSGKDSALDLKAC